jgi:hypothetical protein
MTKRTSLAANGLPSINRRSLVCGLGTATVAGVPALGSAAPKSDDPVLERRVSGMPQTKLLGGSCLPLWGAAASIRTKSAFKSFQYVSLAPLYRRHFKLQSPRRPTKTDAIVLR